MKRIVSLLLFLAVIFGGLLPLSSCKRGDGAPEGMQLAFGSDKLGFYFYAPEGWTVSKHGSVYSAHVSKIDTSSITFTEGKKPEGSVEEYFEYYKSTYPEGMEVTLGVTDTVFGNADSAKKVAFKYTYRDLPVIALQIFITYAERFYIFTYTSFGTLDASGTTVYDKHIEEVSQVISEFKFVGSSSESVEDKPEVDSEGYYLANDPSLSGFSVYLPTSYTNVISSGAISASRADGVSISVAEVSYAEGSYNDYFARRHEELSAIVDKGKDEDGNTVALIDEFPEPTKMTHPDARGAIGLEYSYVLRTKTYKVHQIMFSTLGNLYVFTYTAPVEIYESAHAEALKIFEKIRL